MMSVHSRLHGGEANLLEALLSHLRMSGVSCTEQADLHMAFNLGPSKCGMVFEVPNKCPSSCTWFCR